MDRIKLVIADKDTNYLDLFMDYIRSSDYGRKFNIKSFTRGDALEKHLHSSDIFDMILVTPEFVDISKKAGLGIPIIVLQDSAVSDSGNLAEVFKYQALNQLLSQVLSIYLQENETGRKTISGTHNSRVISVFSAAGGTGKTTVALNLATRLVEEGQEVFYLNLEYLSSSPVLLAPTASNDFSRLLYYLKAKPTQAQASFESFRKREPALGFGYFDTVQMPREMLDMSREDASALVELICSRGSYDLVVVDLEASSHDRIRGALEKSDLIYWLVLDDIQVLHKTRALFTDYQSQLDTAYNRLIRRVRLILNKRLQTIYNPPEHFGLNLSGYLPYVPEWKNVTSPGQLLASSTFKMAVSNLHRSLMESYLGGSEV